MNFRSGMTFALAASLVLGGCAAGAAGGGGPLTSPTGKVYEPGTAPTQTSESRAATLAIATGAYEDALTEARTGIAQDPTNPVHFFLAGQAAGWLEQYELADSMFNVAERIYPAYEMETEESRRELYGYAFDTGVLYYNGAPDSVPPIPQDTDEAIRQWRGAHLIYPLEPTASQNLAIVLTQEGEYEEAIEIYREALDNIELEPVTRVREDDEVTRIAEAEASFLESLSQLLLITDQVAEAEELIRRQLEADPDNVELRADLASSLSQQGREDEASAIYQDLLNAPGLTPTQYFNIGVSLFNAGVHVQAADAFSRVTDVQPNSRDAWYNAANALYAGELWEELVPVAESLVEVDPLNENTGLILARAYRETEQNQDALSVLERLETLPVFVEQVQLRPAREVTTLRGTVVGNAASPGAQVQIRFTFYNDASTIGSETLTVSAPAAEQSSSFEVEVPGTANAYSYELIG